MSHKVTLLFWTIVAAQLALLLGFIGFKEVTLRTGQEVILQTVPVDPRSILQGDYVILQYEVGQLWPQFNDLPNGSVVYVALERRGDVWGSKWQTTVRPSAEEVYLTGRVDGNWLDFGLGTYFVPEGTGHIIERAGDIKVKAVVDRNGRAIIKEILVDGEPFDPNQPTPTPGGLPPSRLPPEDFPTPAATPIQ